MSTNFLYQELLYFISFFIGILKLSSTIKLSVFSTIATSLILTLFFLAILLNHQHCLKPKDI